METKQERCIVENMVEYNKQHPLRLFEICAGYGSQALALKRLHDVFPDFEFTTVGWCDYDPESPNIPIDRQPAVIAHRALHPECPYNWGDLTQIDWTKVPDFDLLTGSTPCQSVSAAGLQHGFEKGSGTRSSIIWNVHDAVRIKRPRFILMENVSAILTDKFLPLLQLWMREVERMGYVNFMPQEFDTPWNGSHTKNGCLNSKNYGTPQNRERWFMVSILRTEDNPEPKYHFPAPFPLERCLADVLEEDVDESFFLSDEMLCRFAEKSVEEEESGVQQEQMERDDFEDFFVAG